MSVVVMGMEMPKDCWNCVVSSFGCCNVTGRIWDTLAKRPDWCPLVELPEKHGRLIDGDALRGKMYYDAFETDSEMQRWDSGCWIRYKMLENNIDDAETIVEAEGMEDG